MRQSAVLLTLLSATASFNGWGATVDVDGTAIKTLSAAVIQAQTQDDGPHVINLKVDKLPTADTDFVITEPVTVNGDADGNGTKCDILVDVASIQTAPLKGELLGKSYIKINAPGNVILNDLQIHPNADGSKSADAELVDAMRIFCPPGVNDQSKYELNRVFISGSDGNNGDKYVSLETADDIYSKAGMKLWSRQSQMGNRGIIHCGNRKQNSKKSEERGEYQLTLNDCQVGMGRGVALNFTASSGNHAINGGIFGHCGLDAIRIAGNTLGVSGNDKGWVRLVRGGASSNNNALISFTPKAQLSKIEKVYFMPVPGAKLDVDTIIPASGAANKKDVLVLTDEADMAAAVKGGALPEPEPFKGWLAPEAAWAEAQAKKQNMVLLFYSPSVPLAEELNKLMENDRGARSFINKNSVGRVNIADAQGQKIAQQYGIFRVPALLLVSSDAKSYQKVTPNSAKTWKPIEAELVKK